MDVISTGTFEPRIERIANQVRTLEASPDRLYTYFSYLVNVALL